jgi:hypothetical protein
VQLNITLLKGLKGRRKTPGISDLAEESAIPTVCWVMCDLAKKTSLVPVWNLISIPLFPSQ